MSKVLFNLVISSHRIRCNCRWDVEHGYGYGYAKKRQRPNKKKSDRRFDGNLHEQPKIFQLPQISKKSGTHGFVRLVFERRSEKSLREV